MSVRAIDWAFKLHTGCALCKLILLKLADHVGKDGGPCWPSNALIARETELADRTVRLIGPH